MALTQVLKDAGVRTSTNGKECWMDNVMIAQPWCSLKYWCVYLHAFETGSEARAGIGSWIDYYNTKRPHSAPAGQTPVGAGHGSAAGPPGHAPEGPQVPVAA